MGTASPPFTTILNGACCRELIKEEEDRDDENEESKNHILFHGMVMLYPFINFQETF